MKQENDALVLACQACDYSRIVKWLQRGANPNTLDHFMHSNLDNIASSHRGDFGDLVQLLLAAKADLSLPQNQCLVSNAANMNHASVVRVLIEAKANVGDDALLYAAKNNNTAIATLLLQAKADILMKDMRGCTALHHAALNKNLQLVEIFGKLMASLDPNPINELIAGDVTYSVYRNLSLWGGTAFHIAASLGEDTILKCLLQYKADPFLRDRKGYSALHHAAYHGFVHTITFLISEAKMDPHAVATNGDTAFGCAGDNNHVAVMELLYRQHYGNVLPSDAVSTLRAAASHGYIESLKFLIESCNMEVETKDENGDTALHHAVLHLPAIKYLILEAKADVTARNNVGDQILHMAASYNVTPTVKYLVEKCGAPPAAVNDAGETPLDQCKESDAIQRFLSKYDDEDEDFHLPFRARKRLNQTRNPAKSKTART